ncbi:hypothetical protein HOB36_07315 [Candidatus Bathyarchaeota archaeon]|nr:hypothetical protein [Candidatus Bathyarchaeota archaeon]
MEDWEIALLSFLKPWKNRQEVIGFLVCGSYITGKPSKHSDIDLHIITSHDTDWRERGSKFIDGYHIEYFVNPPKQIRAYFKKYHRDHSLDPQTMFITGKILYDKTGSVAQLKTEAKNWREKKFNGLEDTSLIIQKYALWDALDNLQDIYEKKSKSFRYAYYAALRNVLEFYSTYLKWEVYSPERVYEYFTDPLVLKKYLQTEYPDPVFGEMFVKAITVDIEYEMLVSFEELADYVFEQTDGFEIDGWVVRTTLELE